VGYPFGKNGWKIYDLDFEELFVSRDVIFYEDIFPYMIQSKSCKDHVQNVGILISKNRTRR